MATLIIVIINQSINQSIMVFHLRRKSIRRSHCTFGTRVSSFLIYGFVQSVFPRDIETDDPHPTTYGVLCSTCCRFLCYGMYSDGAAAAAAAADRKVSSALGTCCSEGIPRAVTTSGPSPNITHSSGTHTHTKR